MYDIVGVLIVAFLIIGFTYGFVRQIQHNIVIQKADKTYVPNYRRSLIGNYLTSISFLGFLISYILNILVATQIIQSSYAFGRSWSKIGGAGVLNGKSINSLNKAVQSQFKEKLSNEGKKATRNTMIGTTVNIVGTDLTKEYFFGKYTPSNSLIK